MELGQNLWDKIHILDDAPVYSQYVFNAMFHRVHGRRHTISIQIEDFYILLGILSADIHTPEGM